MTEIKIKEVQSYTISLDSLDLAYLGKYIHTTRAEKMPLWTKTKLDGETEYCQVQIVRDNDEECYSEETVETTNCHICSVEVPVTCYKEHTESEPHVTLENIFQNILERLSKQIKITIINNDKGFDQDVLYHCVPCSKIIKLDNKQKHEMSPYHIRSQTKLSIVKEFYKMFKKESPANSSDVEKAGNEEIVNEESTLSEKNIGTEYVQIDTTDNGISDHTNSVTNTICSSNDRTTKLDSDDNLITSSFEEYYFKQIIRKHDLKVDLPIVDGDFVHVANPSGIKVKILRDNFHSFTSRNQLIYCQLCDSLFKPEEKNEHKLTGKYIKDVQRFNKNRERAFKKVNEKFARLHCNNIWSHCLICNEVYHTSYISKHCLVDEKHIRTFKSSKIPDVCQNNEESNIAIFSTVVATERTRSSESGERRIVGYIDENKEQSESKKLTNEKDVYKLKENKHNDKEYVGGINMAKDGLDDHISDKNHIEKRRELSPHCVQKVLCGLCNDTVPQDQIEYHNAGTTHWSKAIKNILTGVSIGLQAYLSEDAPKSSDMSDKQKDRTKNENKHYEAKRDENPSKNNNAINNENVITDDNVFNNKNATTKDENATNKDENATTTDENATNKDKNTITEDENIIVKDKNTIPEDENVIGKDKNTITKDRKNAMTNENVITDDNVYNNKNAKIKDENAKTKDENAITKDENAITKDENATNKDENAITKDENAITKDENAITKDENATNKVENATNKDKNAISKDENVIIEDVITITGDENITTKHNEINNENAITEDEYFTNMFYRYIAPPNPFRFTDSTKAKVTCIACDIDIDNTQPSIDAHENSSKHEISVRELKSFHSIKKRNYFNFNIDNKLNTEILYCESCNIDVMDIWEHINTERHTALLQLEFETSIEYLKKFVYDCRTRGIKGDSKASKYREFYKMLLKTNKIVKFAGWHYCSLCDTQLLEIEGSEIEHMLSTEHETELAKIFDSR